MADDSFTSQDINELRQLHDHLVSTNDPRAPQLRTFLQSQNAMGPPPAPYPIAPGITQPFGGFGNYQGYHPSLAAQWTRASEIPEGVGNLLTGHPWTGAAQLAQPALIATPIGAAASDIAAYGIESLPGLVGRAGLAGLGKYLSEINLFKPFTPITGLGSAWDAARASWLANLPKPSPPTEFGTPPPVYGPGTSSTARFAEPLPAAKAPTAAPPVYYPPKPAAAKEPIVAPPPVTYPKPPAAGPVVAPPPVVYRQPPAAEPVVAPPPVAGSSSARFAEPLPQPGIKTSYPPAYGPKTSSTARFAEPPIEAGPGPITIEGVGPVEPVKPKVPKVTPPKPLSYSDASAQWHKTTMDMNLEGFPAGAKTGSWLSNRARELGLSGQSDLTGGEIQNFTNFVQGNKRLPTLEESRGLLRGGK